MHPSTAVSPNGIPAIDQHCAREFIQNLDPGLLYSLRAWGTSQPQSLLPGMHMFCRQHSTVGSHPALALAPGILFPPPHTSTFLSEFYCDFVTSAPIAAPYNHDDNPQGRGGWRGSSGAAAAGVAARLRHLGGAAECRALPARGCLLGRHRHKQLHIHSEAQTRPGKRKHGWRRARGRGAGAWRERPAAAVHNARQVRTHALISVEIGCWPADRKWSVRARFVHPVAPAGGHAVSSY